jgi:hypothetical protein
MIIYLIGVVVSFLAGGIVAIGILALVAHIRE